MTISELIEDLVEAWKIHGDINARVDLLTVNQGNAVEITGIGVYNNTLEIECDITDIKSFKKNFK